MVVVAITCNKCPVAVAVEDRLVEFVKKHGEKVDLVAINVNTHPSDSLEKMTERSSQKGFNFPYVIDETQSIARQLGARVTPEFFVLDKARKIVYTGALDDNAMKPAAVTKHYLEDAVIAVLSDKAPQVAETKAEGCGVGYTKKSGN